MQEVFTMKILLCRFCAESSPNLTTRSAIVVEQADTQTRFRSDCCGGDSTRSGTHHYNVERGTHSVTTSMFGTHNNWHVRR
jgi:hypothetical protein